MISKVVVLAAVVAAAALVGSLNVLPVAAQEEPSASRSLSAESVNTGDEVTVTITADGFGSFAEVVETLPDGFSYVSSSGLPEDQVMVEGQTVTFSLFGRSATFTYTVEASNEAGSYSFSGEFSGVDDNFDAFRDVTVDGPSSVTVEAAETSEPTASRLLPAASVNEGDPVTVTIVADGYDAFADVVETLPAGFAYVSTTGLPADQVTTDGQEVTFSLLGVAAPHTFTYNVTASSEAGSYSFSGEYSGVDDNFDAFADVAVGGDSSITVETTTATGPRATRSISSAPVNPGDLVTVTVRAYDFGSFAEIEETVPAGFAYESTSGLAEADVSVDGQEITFTLLSETAPKTFAYNLTAPDVAGSHAFSGTYSGVDGNFDAFADVQVGGTSSVTVEAKSAVTPTPEPTATATPEPTDTSAVDVGPMVTWNVPQELTLEVRVRPIRPITEDDIASYVIEKGQLPKVLRLDETTGVITGRPVRESSAATTVTIKVTDTSGKDASFELRFPPVRDRTVEEDAPTPTLPDVPPIDLSGVTVGDTAPSSGLQLVLAATGGALLLGGLGVMAARRRIRARARVRR